MKKSAFFISAIWLCSSCLAAGECRDADGNVIDQAQCAGDANASSSDASGLPDDAMAQVNELNTKMRYFKAIGFHKQSKEKRDEIAAIYEQYNVPLPDEFKE
jgi:hypothetical protein